MTKIVGPELVNKITSTLQKDYFSVLTDESTDISNRKQMCLVFRYFDEVGEEVVDRFLNLT